MTRAFEARDDLTDTEKRIIRLVAQGMNYREVAEETGYTVSTIETYASRIGEKIDGPQAPLQKMILVGNGVDPTTAAP